MSHGKERKEKNCLNCNAVVAGRFCQVCGQENLDPNENFRQLCVHFIYDIFHFDGQFFSTLKYLLFKPGFLTKEFFRGKRASYLHPIRMYLFTSAIFFLIYLSINNSNKEEFEGTKAGQQANNIQAAVDALNDSLHKITDPQKQEEIEQQISVLGKVNNFIQPAEDSAGEIETDTINMGLLKFRTRDTAGVESSKSLLNTDYSSVEEYKEAQAKLPEKERDGWFTRTTSEKVIELNQKYKEDRNGFWEKLQENFFHSLPKMMFVSLPLAALILQLLYLRKKQFTYAQHSIFTVHVYIAVFILILVIYALDGLTGLTHWNIFHWLTNIVNIAALFYIYKALRNYYGSSRAKTIFKYILLMLLYSIVTILLIIVFFINSILAM